MCTKRYELGEFEQRHSRQRDPCARFDAVFACFPVSLVENLPYPRQPTR